MSKMFVHTLHMYSMKGTVLSVPAGAYQAFVFLVTSALLSFAHFSLDSAVDLAPGGCSCVSVLHHSLT